jgi:hypothetical protein
MLIVIQYPLNEETQNPYTPSIVSSDVLLTELKYYRNSFCEECLVADAQNATGYITRNNHHGDEQTIMI